MGALSQFFQPPLYWQQFEELTVGLLREAYGSPDAKIYGRPGQAQHGVDVYGKSRYGLVGIQCKRLSDVDENGNPYPGGPISKSFLMKAAKESLAFPQELGIWILATTARRDTRVQGYVDQLNALWKAQGLERIAIVWSWDECISYLNSFPDLQRWYYEHVIQVRASKDLDEIILHTIAMAFGRPAFQVPIHAESPGEFIQALKDTQKALRTGELVDRESRQVIRKAIGGFREVDDPSLRSGLQGVDELLGELRSRLETGLHDGSIRIDQYRFHFTDHGLAHQLARLRDSSRHALDVVLAQAKLPPV
ncbi:hypothetical protein [Caulobacter soli]|uniref:hypothetical protein n=1 Tax=Caulobacter soli TaxID=2708539 RepID=UPI0013EC15A9|nr:hypothetical protein [Caulobacter soli]